MKILAARPLRVALLLAVPVVALAVFGFEAASTSFGGLPPVTDAPEAPKAAAKSVAAAKDSPVLELKTWQETATKSGIRR
jgi:hypothetical protein